MSVTGSRLPVSGSPPNVTLGVAERRVVPGETASFPFTVSAEREVPGVHDFSIASDNPNFDPAWAHIVESTENGVLGARYTLEVRPTDIRHSQYGAYPLRLRWGRPGTPRHAEGRCTVIIKPCVRFTVKPALKAWPTGMVSVSLENCGRADIDVSLSVSHQGSNWSKRWEFELKTGDGPFEFSETFTPPAGARRGSFELDISAEGVSLFSAQIHAKHLIISRKLVTTAAIALAGAAIGTILAIAWPGPAPIAQSITFTSVPPATPAPGSTYHVTAKGGASGNQVTFTIASQSASKCSLSRSTVTFDHSGTCVIHANQVGNATYSAAPEAQQAITVNGVAKRNQSISSTAPASGAAGGSAAPGQTSQSISFSPPGTGSVGQSATLTATGGGSGNAVVFSVAASSGSGVCAVSGTNGSTVSYTAAGQCVIDANQAGNANYTAAPQVTATITVGQAPAFESDSPPLHAVAGRAYSYTFRASGTPAPSYALAPGAPSWLSVDTVTGEVTGTPPPFTGSFSYTVTATNLAGMATTRQFNVSVETIT